MTILTIASRKGGCGKTMLAAVVTASLAEQKIEGGLLDADPNGGAHRWATETHSAGGIHAYAEADAEKLADLLPTLGLRHSALIVDTAGFGSQAAAVAIAGADLVLVPVTPGEGDLVEAQRTVNFVAGLSRSTRREIPVRVLANRLRKGTSLTRHILGEIDALNLPRLQTTMSEAVAYAELGFTGTLPRDRTAATEISSLIRELREIGGIP